jgi:hypothetical protein
MVPVQMVQLVGPKAGVHKSSCHILVHAGGAAQATLRGIVDVPDAAASPARSGGPKGRQMKKAHGHGLR